MKFVDEARLRVAAGDGGDGCSAFLRQKFRPKGGPSGGDGGTGGSIFVCADPGMSTLFDFHVRQLIRAERGQDGRGKNQHGAAGVDTTVRVPVGTMIYDQGGHNLLADLCRSGQTECIAQGGQGGLGNARFATATHQAPRRADPGTPGQKREVRMELRLLAQAGLVGLPNAGKSSLLARVSAARPKVADYPFTTLIPSLGVVRWADDASFVLADIPGLIEGAHTGLGLGTQFLRHLSRTTVLVHVLDPSGRSAEETVEDFDKVSAELAAYSGELASRTRLVVINKIDLPDCRSVTDPIAALLVDRGLDVYAVSAASGEGVQELLNAVGTAIAQQPVSQDAMESDA